jgi:hypothetical protein
VSPFRPSFSPQPRVYPSASSRSVLEHLPSRTNLVGPCPTPTLTLGPSIACRLLNSLASLFATPVLCFQQLAASLPKIPGGGVSLRDNSARSAALGYHFRPICTPFVFRTLQIPFAPTRLFSHPYKTPGVWGCPSSALCVLCASAVNRSCSAKLMTR